MANDQSNPKPKNPNQKYDLEERTAKFAERIVDFCQKLARTPVTEPIIRQLIRAGTSIGANYCEADEASTKKDFLNKIAIANKETKESSYWLRVIAHALPICKDEARVLWKEAREFNLIFSAIIRNSKNSKGAVV